MSQAFPTCPNRLWAVLVAAMAVSACGGGGDSSGAPSTGSQTATAAPAPAVPPVATSKAATLSWTAPLENVDGSVLQNLTGFRIYYGQNAANLASTITVTNASVSTYIVENLAVGTWYFGVSALNAQGVESPLSNIASKIIS